MRKIGVFFIISLFFIGCQKKEEKIIPKKDMEDILVEMHIFDGMIAHSTYRGKLDSIDTLNYEEAILNRYDYTRAQFDSSLNYYSANLRDFDKIYQAVLNRLNRMQTEAKEQEDESTLKRKSRTPPKK
jgi:hypothetical protein